MARSAIKCPGCASQMVRYSSVAWRHLLRCLIGSRARYCLTCGQKWGARWRWGPAHPLTAQELEQAARHSLIVPASALIVGLGWVAFKARQASAQLQALAYLSYHARYIQSLKTSIDSSGYHFPISTLQRLRISSRFGYRYHPILHSVRFHQGTDIPLPWGTPVFPARSGRVEKAGFAGDYGLRVVIRHADNETTTYGHLSRILVAAGDSVEAGKTTIGRVGSTGLSTGPHLHFEVRDSKDNPIDPSTLLNF